MKFTLQGDYPSRHDARCWRAIEATIDEWISAIDGASLQGRFLPDDDSLQFKLTAPGCEPKTRHIDVSWIAYADQAEHLALQTQIALKDLDSAMLTQGEESVSSRIAK